MYIYIHIRRRAYKLERGPNRVPGSGRMTAVEAQRSLRGVGARGDGRAMLVTQPQLLSPRGSNQSAIMTLGPKNHTIYGFLGPNSTMAL